MDDYTVECLGEDVMCALLKRSMTVLVSKHIATSKRAKTTDHVANLFGTPLQETTQSIITVGTPKMDIVFVSLSRGKGTTY